MEQIFTFLFKYRPFHFREGEFLLQWRLEAWLLAILVCAILLAAWLPYRGWLDRTVSRRWILPAARAAFLLGIMVLLMRPSLILSTLAPRENVLALLVDNSLSMGIADEEAPRGEAVRALLEPGSPLRQGLDDRFRLLRMGFDAESRVLREDAGLDWRGSRTDISGALRDVLTRTRHEALGGIVLFSDGADNGLGGFKEILADLQARRIPVHTVGVGPRVLEPDLEMTQVSLPRILVPETRTIARVTLRIDGYQGRESRLEVWEGNSLIQDQEVKLPFSQTALVEVPLTPRSRGIRIYRFRIRPLENEALQENNERSAVLHVRDLENRILYVEGRPRWEYKFIRSAVAGDRHLRLESLLRTAINKYYRQGIEEESTLAAGFPSTREELFSYRALVVGSVESSFFTYPQMEMLREFVDKRGGGFLMLGGSSSFSAGEYQNTPVEELLPVWMMPDEDMAPSDTLYRRGSARVELTPQGLRHPALQLGAGEAVNRRQWEEMPDLKDWNRVGGLKPGATVLARLQDSQDGTDVPLMVFQRYGRGLAMAFLTGSSWRWQMLQEHEDRSHENFWQQVLRWLVNAAKDPVEVETEREIYSQGEEVKVQAQVYDPSFNPVQSARLAATLVSPSGGESGIELDWSPRDGGVYEGVTRPVEEGLHHVRLEAEGASGAKLISYGAGDAYFLAQSGLREFHDANRKVEFLNWLAQETGGHYYSLDDVGNLPEEVSYVESHASVPQTLELWDMPVNFLLLAALLMTEWVMWRRLGGI